MEIKDALDMMNSDYKLWESATKEELGGGKVKMTIDLPWDIGEYTIELEGMNDSIKRRTAVSAYGEHIRSVIDDCINDEAITQRAIAAAGKAERLDSDNRDAIDRERGVLGEPEEVQKGSPEEATEAHEEVAEGPVDYRASISARRAQVNERGTRLRRELDELSAELEILDRVMAAFDED